MPFESVCKFYTYNRNCKFGQNCRYLHSSEISVKSESDSFQQDNGAVKELRDQSQSFQLHQVQSTQVRTNHEEALSSSHLETPSPNDLEPTARIISNDAPQCVISARPAPESGDSDRDKPRNICRYFKQHGYCAFGRNCRFIHDESRPVNVGSKPKLSQNARKQIPPRFQKKEAFSSSPQHALEDLSLETPETKDCTKHGRQSELNVPGNESSNLIVAEGGAGKGHGYDLNSKRNGKLCKYFKAGYCSRGRRCMFLHYIAKSDKYNEGKGTEALPNNTEVAENHKTQPSEGPESKIQNMNQRPMRQIGVFPQVLKLSDIESSGTEKCRLHDVNYLQKRFHAKTVEESESTMEVIFSPSDPDWPFDVKAFTLDLTLPEDYPVKAMSVSVPTDKQDLPETVRRYLEVCLNEWITDRQEELTKNSKAELMVRPFFRWLDRNCEDVMTEALKQLKRELTARAAGFEFIPATHLKAKYTVDPNSDDGSASQKGESDDSLAEDEDDSSDECLESDDNSDDEESNDEGEGRQPALDLDTDRKGTEIQLRHMQLKQNASSLLFEKLRLLIQCTRCKHHSEVTVGSERAVALTCEKCNQDIYVQYRPTLAHQFSSVVGYLDLDNGQAFDIILPDCKIVVSCMACGKLTKINGMTSGQLVDGWCQACNGRFKFATEAVKFYQLQPSNLDEEKKKRAEKSRSQKSKKPPKDPAIREGEPLPGFGTCRHYKQSYRWLRFPCCGKAYPCDVCHDKKEDHEMILANRMICGHCCKEQNYSASRPCASCGHHMTKVRSAHWEGGQGCRDRIAMSRNDQQKYKNMNKTISKKKVQSGTGSKAKNTKLRHA